MFVCPSMLALRPVRIKTEGRQSNRYQFDLGLTSFPICLTHPIRADFTSDTKSHKLAHLHCCLAWQIPSMLVSSFPLFTIYSLGKVSTTPPRHSFHSFSLVC